MSDIHTGDLPDAAWFQRVADSSGLVFFLLRVHPDLAFEYVNGGMRTQLVGRRPGTTTADAEALFANLHPDSRPALAEMLALEPGRSLSVELRWLHVNGDPVYSRGWVHCRRREDETVVIEGAMQDVTDLHRMETELRNSEDRHRLLAQNAWDVVWTMGLDGSITYVSPAVERVRGFTPQEAMAQTLDQIHPPGTAAKVTGYFADLFSAIANGTLPPTYRGEHEYYRKDGSIMLGEMQVIPHVDPEGRVVEILGVTRDISLRREFEAELTKQAVTDPLTGLWNRRHTTELLAAELPYGRPMTLLLLDVDHFKQINDTHGHQTGDRVLVELSRRLLSGVRGSDVVSRWGGEEFVVLLRFCAPADGLGAAEELRRRISETPFPGIGAVTVSIGAAELLPGDDIDTWIKRADNALYQAKRSGRNAVVAG